MPSETQPAERIAFGCYELEIKSGELFKKGRRVRLTGQPVDLLAILASRQGTLVSREELRLALWPGDTFVDFDHGLNNCIRRIRDVLGDSAESPRYIETLPKKGYRFIAETQAVWCPRSPATLPDADRTVAVSETPAVLGPERDISGTHQSRWREPVPWVVSSLLVILAIASVLLLARPLRKPHTGSGEIHSLALLPLKNLSGDASQDYLADGVTDELITQLAQSTSVPVISRTSAMVYKNKEKSVAEITRELNVDAVVEGTLSRTGDRLRMTVHLIKGPSNASIWSQAYDGDMRNVRELEMRVAGDVAAHLHGSPQPQGNRKPKQVPIEAYEEYQKGQTLWEAWKFWQALRHFQRAAAIEPDYADAYGGIARTYCLMEFAELLPSDVALAQASDAAEKAISLDKQNRDGHAARGYVLAVRDWKWPEAEAELQRAIEIDPSSSYLHVRYQYFLCLKKRREADALSQAQLAARLDPVSTKSLGVYAGNLARAGHLKESVEQYQAAIELDPTSSDPEWRLGLAEVLQTSGQVDRAALELEQAYILAGAPVIAAKFKRDYPVSGYAKAAAAADRASALDHLADLDNKRSRGEYVSPSDYAETYAALQNTEETLRSLREAYREHSHVILQLAGKDFDFIRNDPRFRSIYDSVPFYR